MWKGRLPRPGRGALSLLAVALLLEAVGRVLASGWVTLAAAGLLGAVIADGALTPAVRRVTVARDAPSRMTCGVEAETTLSATPRTSRRRAAGPFVLSDRHPALSPATGLVPRMFTNEAATVTLRRTPTGRGFWPGGATVTIEGRSPLGGFTRRRSVTIDEPTWVHPATSRASVRTQRSAPNSGGSGSSNRPGPGEEIYGLREWRPGDATGAVHGRASARRGRPVVLEREAPDDGAQVIALGAPGAGPEWEAAVTRAASTAVDAVRSRRRLRLVSGDATAAPTSVTEVLDWFAAVDECAPADSAQVSAALARGASSIVWLSATALPPAIGAAIGARRAPVDHLGAPLGSDAGTTA